MTPLILELPYATPSQNQWQRWHWGKRAKWKSEATMWLWSQVPCREGEVKEKRRVVFTRYSAGTLDRGNFVGGCKGLLDCLVGLGLLKDDAPQWCEDVYVQEKAPRNRARTVVEVSSC